jgi:hypothetical protein
MALSLWPALRSLLLPAANGDPEKASFIGAANCACVGRPPTAIPRESPAKTGDDGAMRVDLPDCKASAAPKAARIEGAANNVKWSVR